MFENCQPVFHPLLIEDTKCLKGLKKCAKTFCHYKLEKIYIQNQSWIRLQLLELKILTVILTNSDCKVWATKTRHIQKLAIIM